MTTTNVPHTSSQKNVIKTLIISSLLSLIAITPIVLTLCINHDQFSYNFPKNEINPEHQKVADLYYQSFFSY